MEAGRRASPNRDEKELLRGSLPRLRRRSLDTYLSDLILEIVPASAPASGTGYRRACQPITLTFSACGPLGPCVMSNSTFCPSSRLR